MIFDGRTTKIYQNAFFFEHRICKLQENEPHDPGFFSIYKTAGVVSET